jgi:hypothetical protein
MLKGILIKTTGEMETIEYEDTLETLQGFVGGYIDYVTIGDGVDMIINDEGKIMGLEPNWVATFLWGQPDMIVGDVLVVGIGDEGENIALTNEQIAKIYERVK